MVVIMRNPNTKKSRAKRKFQNSVGSLLRVIVDFWFIVSRKGAKKFAALRAFASLRETFYGSVK
jgi:hypothetical protein